MKQDVEAVAPGLPRRNAIGLATAGEFGGLLLLCFLTHALALRFVFPGFYEPTLFEHSDFYVPSSLRYGGQGFFAMFGWGRPIGMAYLYAVGWIGTDGSIWATFGIIFANIILLAMMLRKWCRIDLGWPFILAFFIFSYCLFSHPYFFTMANHDALAQLSFLLLAIGCTVLVAPASPSVSRLAILFILMVLAFSSKETFALAVFWLLACIGGARMKHRLSGALGLSALGIAAFVIAFVYGLQVKSGFISNSGDAANTYHQSYNPLTIAVQFVDYVKSGTPIQVLLVLLLTYLCLIVFLPLRFRLVAVALVVAGMATIVPNTTLPNHFFPGYSWNMGYFLFAPLLLFPLVRDRMPSRVADGVGLAFGVLLVVGLPYFWRPSYAMNDWTMQEAAIQRNVRHSLDVLSQSASLGQDHRRVLVTGLSDLFSPFDEGEAIREWVGNSNAQFDVVSYSPRPSAAASVHFLMPDQVQLESYTDIWAFARNGTGKEITATSGFPETDFLRQREMILYPDALAALGFAHFANHGLSPDANQLLQCGIKLVAYHAYDLAIVAFNRSITQMPKNPYAFFYEALAYQALGRRDEALSFAHQAIAADVSASPNPYFATLAESLQRDSH